jgi:hypothetical protein
MISGQPLFTQEWLSRAKQISKRSGEEPRFADGSFAGQSKLAATSTGMLSCWARKPTMTFPLSFGDLIGKIPVPEKVANVCFGGPTRDRLYICGHTSLYAIHVNTRGAQAP